MLAAKSLNRFISLLVQKQKIQFIRQKSDAPRIMSKIVWIDVEMTGLDVRYDKIMEIACIITNNNLDIVAEHPSIVIHQPDSLLNSMDNWCTTTHTKTGLLDECRKSTITEKRAKDMVLKFISENGVESFACPLAGNSVYMDRMFLREYMPRIDQYLHYRIIDVSTVKELCKRWNKSLFSRVPSKNLVHRGLSDIKESIDELKFYKQHMFTSNAG